MSASRVPDLCAHPDERGWIDDGRRGNVGMTGPTTRGVEARPEAVVSGPDLSKEYSAGDIRRPCQTKAEDRKRQREQQRDSHQFRTREDRSEVTRAERQRSERR